MGALVVEARGPARERSEAGRVSRTVIKPEPGFRAELPGLDLATLIQMTCARRERQVVRVASSGEEGFLYSAEGRLVHATVGDLAGDEAVLRMLSWPTGDFSICERPFPLDPTIDTSTEGLLLRAAQRSDEAALDHETDMVLGHEPGLSEQLEGEEPVAGQVEDEPTALQPAFQPYAPLPALSLPRQLEIDVELASSVPPPPRRASVPPPPPSTRAVSWPLPIEPPSRTPALASLLQARTNEDLPTTPTPRPIQTRDAIAPSTPPPRSSRPPPGALPPVSLGRISEPPRRISEPPRRPSEPSSVVSRASVSLPRPISPARSESGRRLPPPPPARKSLAPAPEEDSVLASVRLDARGEVVGTFGGHDQLAQLVAYVSRIATLVQADFALDPFDALHAELSGKRVLIYQDHGELIGMVMKPSSAAQELRQRLGV